MDLFGVIFVYWQMSDKGQLLMINGYTWNRFVLYFGLDPPKTRRFPIKTKDDSGSRYLEYSSNFILKLFGRSVLCVLLLDLGS